MLVLGINAFHADSAAAILNDGALLAAVEEERFRRIKHWAGFPAESVRYCLAAAGAALSDVDHVAVNQDGAANLSAKVRYLVARRPSMALVLERVRNRQERHNIPSQLNALDEKRPFRGEVHAVEHHKAHLASAFYASPFERAVVLSVDGFGDFASGAWGIGDGEDLSFDGKVYFPHSLGIFYQALTQYLGFPNYGDEYKVMGLAPLGKPAFLEEMRKIVRLGSGHLYELDLKYFTHHSEQIAYQWDNGSPTFADLFSPALEQLLGPRRQSGERLEARHQDIAASVQAMYEEAFFRISRALQLNSGLTDIVLAGGCAANSVANGKLRRVTGYRRVFVHPAPGDAGGAVGAALQVWRDLGGKRRFVMNHAYWGPEFSADDIEAAIAASAQKIAGAHCTVETVGDEAALCRRTAEAIAHGRVVGWFQGRMEWGPRALGNRSIVCDPRRADMKAILNAKIKRRESFRPFAPSVLAEAVNEWFEEDDDVPFMMQVFQIREAKRALIPAVTHVDGSGRLQTVKGEANPLYHRLISAFRDLTGVPMVLNTSFNENEPVVCRPEEALDCFLRTEMDVLVMGNRYIERQTSQCN